MNEIVKAPRIRRTQLIYLDLNKWGDLAGAANGHKSSARYEPILKAARECVRTGAAVFPLSALHLMEISKIGNEDRRRRLARIMTELSQGMFLASASLLIHDGLKNAVAAAFNRPELNQSVKPLTQDLFEMFGIADGNSELAHDSDKQRSRFSDAVRSSPVVLQEMLAGIRAQRSFLDEWGSFAQQHERSREIRWELSKADRKRAHCAVVLAGLAERLTPMLSDAGVTIEDLQNLGPDGLVNFIESVPVLDVEINLFTQRNEHRDRKIAANDEIDIGFLSISIPYCDAVVSENFWTSLARRLRLDVKYGTTVEPDLTTLGPFLKETYTAWMNR